MIKTILLVAEAEKIRILVKDYFTQSGYRVVTACTGNFALSLAPDIKPDLVIVHGNLPDMPAVAFMRLYRQSADTPALVLANGHESGDRVAGLKAGADDCINSPCSMRELATRVRAVLRRSGQVAPRAEILVSGDITLDRNGQYIRIDGSCIDLTPTEFELLAAFMTRPGYTLSREDLIDLLHGNNSNENVRTIDVHIKNLRAKIEPDPGHPRYVKTVYGSGYRLAVK